MTWRAQVTDDFLANQLIVRIADMRHDDFDAIIEIRAGEAAVVQTFDISTFGLDGLRLPRAVAEPLRDALDVFLGRPRDDYRARYEEAQAALEVERERVQQLIDLAKVAWARGEVQP